MILALIALATMPDLVPARWPSNDLATLNLVKRTPINCLLIESKDWSRAFNEEAEKRGIHTLAVIRPQPDPVVTTQRSLELRFGGAVLEGAFDPAEKPKLRKILSDAKLPVIELTLRSEMKFDEPAPVIGTYQGLWPGIQLEHDGSAKAAPSGAAWIDTNTGFLRFARASSSSAIWIANRAARWPDLCRGTLYPSHRRRGDGGMPLGDLPGCRIPSEAGHRRQKRS